MYSYKNLELNRGVILVVILGLLFGLAASFSPIISTIIALTGLLLALAYFHPFLVLLLTIVIMPFNIDPHYFGIKLDLTGMLLLALLLVWLAKTLIRRDIKSIQTGYLHYLLPFLVIVLLSSFVADNQLLSLQHFSVWVRFAIAYFLTINLIKNRKQLTITIFALLISGGLFAAHGVYQLLTAQKAVLYATLDGATRAYSIFSHPNQLAGYLGPILFIGAGIFIYSKSIKTKILSGTISILILLGLITTFSRGAWVSLVASVIVMMVLMRHEVRWDFLKKLIIPTFCILIIASLITPTTTDIFMGRAGSLMDQSEVSIFNRKAHFTTAFSIIQEFPLLGVGGLNYQLISRDFAPAQGLDQPGTEKVHSFYLNEATQTGIISVLILLAFFLVSMRTIMRLAKKAKTGYWKGISFGLLGCCIVFLVYSSIEIFTYITLLFAFLFGIIFASGKIHKTSSRS